MSGNSDKVREAVCAGLENLGYALDTAKNAKGKSGKVTEIQVANSTAKILIVATNEELEIALQTESLIKG